MTAIDDKALADGFDFEEEAKRALRCGECDLPEGPAECLCQQVVNDMVDCARRAYAAGIAKCEAEMAALREALKEAREICESARMIPLPMGAHAARLLARIDAALGERKP